MTSERKHAHQPQHAYAYVFLVPFFGHNRQPTNTASCPWYYRRHNITAMKLSGAITAICLASATAFAPAPVSRVSFPVVESKGERILSVMFRHGIAGSSAFAHSSSRWCGGGSAVNRLTLDIIDPTSTSNRDGIYQVDLGVNCSQAALYVFFVFWVAHGIYLT